ncbi:hypothetical protein C8J57DRAFT_1313607 [Mycena rebaudengoi]|nr:hypothetical protein C8J57DRAFT_1313607 [Mycena rebaudengoi]
MSETATLIYTSGTGQLMTMAAAYGVYALLFCLSVFLLIHKGIRNSRPRQILLFSTCLMFTASTALACVDTSLYIVQITQTDYTETYNGLQLSCEILFDSLFLMGDTIVLWRTWSLCKDRRALVLFPMTLWFGGFACLLTLIGFAVHNGSSSNWTVGVYDTDLTNHLSMSTAALSAATNFFSTLLISWKAWQHRALFNSDRSANGPATRVRRIMSLLVESGFIYFAFWILAMLNFYLIWNAPVLQAALRGLYDMVIGIYPTLIIILVSLDYTFWDCAPTDAATNSSVGIFSTMTPFSTNGGLASVRVITTATSSTNGSKNEECPKESGWQ